MSQHQPHLGASGHVFGKVIASSMVMTVELDSGERVLVPGTAAPGTAVVIYADGVELETASRLQGFSHWTLRNPPLPRDTSRMVGPCLPGWLSNSESRLQDLIGTGLPT